MGAQYFQLDNWNELSACYSEDELWKINEKVSGYPDKFWERNILIA